jgi:hypothetical protein
LTVQRQRETTLRVLNLLDSALGELAQARYESWHIAREDRHLYEWSAPDAPQEVVMSIDTAIAVLEVAISCGKATSPEWHAQFDALNTK